MAEYAALGETESCYTELQEGRLLLSPNPGPTHNFAVLELQVEPAAPDEPGFSRRPDLIVADLAGIKRAEESGQLVSAKDVLIVVEIVSPSSRRTDHVIKHGEYADAGIPHYWIIDLTEPVSLTACHLAPGFGYQNAPEVSGRTTLPEPFPVEIDLGQLSR